MFSRAAAIAAFLFVVFPAAAAARTTVVSDSAHWQPIHQRWVDQSLVPSPTMALQVTVRSSLRGFCQKYAVGCAIPGRIWLNRRWGAPNRFTFFHELGHQFDLAMRGEARWKFLRIIGAERPWDMPPAPGADSPRTSPKRWWVDPYSYTETFAGAYAYCALQERRPARLGARERTISYAYYPTKVQYRRVCALIREEAAALGW